MKKVLVTGAAGFIPSHLIDGLLNRGYKVLGVDNMLTGNIRNISESRKNGNFEFLEIDVNDIDKISPVFIDYNPDFVFHYAACVGVKRTLDNPLWVLRDIKGIENILHLSKQADVERVFYSSSSEVYGEPVEFPQNEDTTPLNSKLPYAVVKNIGEVYLKTFQKEYGVDYTIFRFFNTFGPRQSPDFVISKFINAALRNEPITVYGKGDQTRTFCYVSDNIEATINAMESQDAINKVINIGSDKELPIVDLAKIIISFSNSESEIQFLPPLEEGDMTRRLPATDNMRKLLGREVRAFEDGILDTISYFKNYAEKG